MSLRAVVPLLLLVAACNSDADGIRDEQRKWLALGIRDYVFVYHQPCFCIDAEPVRVSVRDRELMGAFDVASGRSTTSGHTLDDIFDTAIRGVDDGPDAWSVHYDPTYHFIDKLTLVQDEDTEDGAYSFEVTCFSKDATGCPEGTLTQAECEARGGLELDQSRWDYQSVCGTQRKQPAGPILGEAARVCCVTDPR